MLAGQSARAGGSGEVQLAVRLAPGAPLQQVDQAIVPALQPRSTTFPKPRPEPASAPPAAPSSPEHADAASASQPGRPPRAAPLVLPYADGSSAGHAAAPLVRAPQPVQTPPAIPAAAALQPGARTGWTGRRELVRPGLPVGAAQAGGGAAAEEPGARTDRTGRRELVRPGASADAQARDASEGQSAPSRPSMFERLTAGMLDEVDPRREPAAPPLTIR
jgi:hypothetical protein